jgi:hypothetical protein
MNQEQIKAKSAELAALYAAKANGKTLQCLLMLDPKEGCWIDHDNGSGPNLHSDLSRWRVKPEPRRIWVSGTAWTGSPVIAAALKEAGQETREFVEVLP